MVSLAPGLRLLVVWYRRGNAGAEPAVPGSFLGGGDRSPRDNQDWEGRHRRFPHVPRGTQGTYRVSSSSRHRLVIVSSSARRQSHALIAISLRPSLAPQGRANAGTTQSSIPLEKVEDFGVHADRYYEDKSSFFKTETDEFALDDIRADRWADVLSRGPTERAKKEDIIKQEIEQLSKKVFHAVKTRPEQKQGTDVVELATAGTTSGKMKTLVPRSNQISAVSFNDSMTEIVKDLLFLS